MRSLVVLVLIFAYFSSTFGAPVQSTCNGDTSAIWYIEDDEDHRYYYQCWGSGAPLRRRCAPGSCVAFNFGVSKDQVVCGSHCSHSAGPVVPPTPSTPTVGFQCNFETDTCGMTITADGFYEWETFTGAATTPGTGATGDHTSGSGKYLTADADNGLGASKTTTATTPMITIMEPSALEFYYNMFGSKVYQLGVWIKYGSTRKILWSRNGDQGANWNYARVPLPGGIQGGYQIEFVAKTQATFIFEGDIGIDDIRVMAGEAVDADHCGQLKAKGATADGWYKIRLNSPDRRVIEVKCYLDMGQTVIQHRMDSSIDFNRTWADYKAGFGNKMSWWAGLENIHYWTTLQTFKLNIKLTDHNNRIYVAEYENFNIGTEAEKYHLTVASFSGGDAGNALLHPQTNLNHNNMKFSTWDQDNDLSSFPCARQYESGWWFNYCWAANLNGLWTTAERCQYTCAQWKTLGDVTFKEVSMSIY